ncbi:hypothetical protein SAMN04488090_0424 [Siphonobacter aquaeclarae]|uniref:Uncharacterized protein n=1 Tax=Siphonobacter aquaeclarae TaxID=563176 RepID=A0A1G9ID01_9BACT|nr:hypothetical protein SAMN04488090_0424 [Siphonobacter aquaeclarae]
MVNNTPGEARPSSVRNQIQKKGQSALVRKIDAAVFLTDFYLARL